MVTTFGQLPGHITTTIENAAYSANDATRGQLIGGMAGYGYERNYNLENLFASNLMGGPIKDKIIFDYKIFYYAFEDEDCDVEGEETAPVSGWKPAGSELLFRISFQHPNTNGKSDRELLNTKTDSYVINFPISTPQWVIDKASLYFTGKPLSEHQ